MTTSRYVQLTSPKIRHVNEITGTNLAELFVAEAKQHFDIEGGKRCLTTIQALYIFFMVTCHVSTNKGGMVYRLGALDYLNRFDPNKILAEYRRGDGAIDRDTCRSYLKTYWGIFNTEWCVVIHEMRVDHCHQFHGCPPKKLTVPPGGTNGIFSVVCHTHLRPPSIRLPPLAFFPDGTDDSQSTPGQPQAAGRVAPATNRISDMLYRVLTYNCDPIPPVGDESDMRVRNDLLFQLQVLENSVIPNASDPDAWNRHTTLVK